jgi:hypothetical protein
MNQISYTSILQVIHDRKTALIQQLEDIQTPKDKRRKLVGDPPQIFAKLQECDLFLTLIKDKIDATAESELRKFFAESDTELRAIHSRTKSITQSTPEDALEIQENGSDQMADTFTGPNGRKPSLFRDQADELS